MNVELAGSGIGNCAYPVRDFIRACESLIGAAQNAALSDDDIRAVRLYATLLLEQFCRHGHKQPIDIIPPQSREYPDAECHRDTTGRNG